MNYQEMSDEQIEFAVSDAINIPRGDKWCSDWAEAGPIIEKHGISIQYRLEEWFASSPTNFATGFMTNPLRAAMIVFLMMKGGD